MDDGLQRWNEVYRSRGGHGSTYGIRVVAVLTLALVLTSCSTPTRYLSAPRDAADAIECGKCRGSGRLQTCPQCDGAGQTVRSVAGLRETGGRLNVPTVGQDKELQATSCLACSGSGVRPAIREDGTAHVCDRCNGTGRVYRCDSSENCAPEP